MRTDLSTNGHTATSLPALIDLYLLRCQVEGKSPRTVSAYGDTLQRFLRVGEQEGFPTEANDIEPAHLYAIGAISRGLPSTRQESRGRR